MSQLKKIVSLWVLLSFCLTPYAQRTYKPASVLATGAWYKISIGAEGVYKMDAGFLSSLGIGGSLPSAQIRIFGNRGGMLPEANKDERTDDLEEVAILVEDGGDGQMNGTDYILFYSTGPHQWIKDSANRRFSHKKNLYSETSFYFISVGGAGKRVSIQTALPPTSIKVTSFDDRFFHELDTVNFLSSGKEWWGEEFSALPGRSLSRSIALPLTDILPGQATIITSAAARSVNNSSRFTIAVNNEFPQQVNIPPINTGQYQLFAQQAQKVDVTTTNQTTATLNFTYLPGSVNSQGWLNWTEFFCRRALVLPTNKQLAFRDWSSVNNTSVGFTVLGAGAAATQIWDVTDPAWPIKMNSSAAGNGISFQNDATRLREYIAFSTTFLTPKAEGRVAAQNLHATIAADYLLVTPPQFIAQAQRLALFHQQRNNLTTVIATTDQIFNEFSGGIADPAAIRDYVKMYFDKYAATWNSKGKYLLLFGKASFDYKNRIINNTNMVPAYESASSLDPLSTYTSDDFFGFLEDAEDINSSVVINTLDIGVGRIPAKKC
jgi:hypothetical protein